MTISAIFFDKDGTLVENVPYNVFPERIKFAQGAEKALCALQKHFEFHIVTNQAGIARGLFEESELRAVQEKLDLMFKEIGTVLKGFHYCPHALDGIVKEYSIPCECRKPGSLMITKAAQINNIDLSSSWMIGDILDDVEAGNRAGCKTIFLDVGNETEWIKGPLRTPHYSVKGLEEAAEIIGHEMRFKNE